MTPQVVFGLIILLITIIVSVVSFLNLSKDQKIKNIKEWLKWAVTEAEKELGGGTGQLKLRMVYDMAINQFPWLIQLIDFNTFSSWVDEALEWMKDQLENNKAINNYVEN